MKLQRFSSTALPQKVHLSPEQAAAAAAAPGKFGATVAGVVSDFALTMQKAEDRSKVREQEADWGFQLANFETDPRWLQDEVDGRPTEQVMAEEYDTMIQGIDNIGEDISSRSAREDLRTNLQLKAAKTGLNVRDRGNRVRIRRTKARDKQTIEQFQMSGDWAGASSVIQGGYDDGIYTLDEKNALTEQVDKLERLDPYISQLGTNDAGHIESMALQALNDPTLRAAEKIDMWRTMSAAADHVESEYFKERESLWRENSVDLWTNFDDITPTEISGGVYSPETKKAALLMKRSEAAAGKTVDNPAAKLAIYELLAELTTNPEVNPDHITRIIGGYAASGELSYETAKDLMQETITYTDTVFAGATYSDILTQGEKAITKGVFSEDVYSTYGEDLGPQVAALATEWRMEMMEAKIDEGASFDPRAFFKERMDAYQNRADAIYNPTGQDGKDVSWYLSNFRMSGGQYDRASIFSEIEKRTDLSDVEKAAMILQVENYR